MGSYAGWLAEDLNNARKRIAELEKQLAERSEDLVASLDEMDTELGKAQVEIEQMREATEKDAEIIDELKEENERLTNLALNTLPQPVDGTFGQVMQDAERYQKLHNLGCAIPVGFTGQLVNDLHTYRNTVLDSVVDAMEGE